MKVILNAVFIFPLLLGAVASASAAEPVRDVTGLERLGMISVANASTLSDLESLLKAKAEQRNARYFKIVSASGDNRLYGTAVIYR